MKTRVRNGLPMLLCILPGIAVGALVGLSLLTGGAAFRAPSSGSAGLILVALAILACPVGMGLMMWRRHASTLGPSSGSAPTMACCLPGEEAPSSATSSGTERLAALRARREALERELADLQAKGVVTSTVDDLAKEVRG